MKPCLLFLTCANEKEADEITQALLEKHLVACVKKMPASSRFLDEGKIDQAQEVLLMMESAEEKFSEIEKVVRQIHSYQTFVLVSMPVTETTTDVEKWIKNSLKLK